MSDFGQIYEVLRAIAPPPCEKYKCTKFNECAEQLLACKAFQFYTTSGRSTDPRSSKNEPPTHALYKRIYVVKQEKDPDATHD